MQFHGVQYLYNMKTLRKKLWTHFPGSTKNMHLTPWLISTFYHDIPGNSGLQHMIERAENEWILQYLMSSKWVTVFSDMLNLRNQSSSCFFVNIYTSIHLFNFSYSILKPVDFFYIGLIWEWHALCCWWIHASHASLCYDISGTGTIRVKFMLQDSDGWCDILLSVQTVKCIL